MKNSPMPRRCLPGAILSLGASVVLSGCQADRTLAELPGNHPTPTLASDTVLTRASAQIQPAAASNVHGTVNFTSDEKGGVRVEATINGLTPGPHGFHIHQTGDCSAPDGSSAGGHFNPGGEPHGGPTAERRHAGDLGNLQANAAGIANYSKVFTDLVFTGPAAILGKAVIIHAGPDDFTSQPAGNAGGRIACGVIELK